MESPYASLAPFLIGLVALITLAAVLALVARSRSRPGASELAAGVADQTRAQAQALVVQGRPEEAVELLHNLAGLPRGDAQSYVDAIRAAAATGAPSVPDGFGEVRALLARGNKIGAVKWYRDRFAVGLKEAKDAVEAIERGQPPPPAAPRQAAPAPTAADGMEEVHALLARGNKIGAIKRYRELSGVGLKEAKDYVEALAARR